MYHADFEKMKGTKQTIADDLETLRASKSAQIASEVSYRGVKSHRDEQELHRPDQAIDDGITPIHYLFVHFHSPVLTAGPFLNDFDFAVWLSFSV